MHRDVENKKHSSEGRVGAQQNPFLSGVLKHVKRCAAIACATVAMSVFVPPHSYETNNAAASVSIHHQAAHRHSDNQQCNAGSIGQRRGIFVYFNDFDTNSGRMRFDKALETACRAGFNIILPEAITFDGYSNFVSEFVPRNQDSFRRVGRHGDPMGELIKQARKYNMRVNAWWMPFVGNNALYEKHRDWSAISERLHRNVYLDFINPKVRKYEIGAIMQFVKNYRVQGINLDNEFPVDHISYSDYDRRLFMHENGIEKISWPKDVLDGGRYNGLWLEWTNGKLVEFFAQLRREIKGYDKNLLISYDVTRNPNDGNYYSMWGTWAKYADVVMPMIYGEDSHFGPGRVGGIMRRDAELAQRGGNRTRVIGIVGGSMDATGRMPPEEWGKWVGYDSLSARSGPGNAFVFAYICVDRDGAEAWESIRNAFRYSSEVASAHR